MNSETQPSVQQVPTRAPMPNRRWGAGALVQPWITALQEMWADVPGWWQERMLRAVGKVAKRRFTLPSVPLSALAPADSLPGFPILDDVCLPPFVVTDTHNDFEALLKLVVISSPGLVLELGTAYGNTVANICRACPQTRVVTVNALPETISGRKITYALTKEDIGRVYRRYGFSDRVVQVWADTMVLDLSPYLNPSSVDLTIIDACHDYEYVLNDFLKVVPYVRRGGMVLLHDTHPSIDGSYRACVTLRRRGFDLRHVQQTWWGVWVNHGDGQNARK